MHFGFDLHRFRANLFLFITVSMCLFHHFVCLLLLFSISFFFLFFFFFWGGGVSKLFFLTVYTYLSEIMPEIKDPMKYPMKKAI